MSFELKQRILAVDPEMVEILFPALLGAHGEDLPDGNRVVRTIGAHWDDSEHTRIRAASFPTTITGTLLTDGRMAFTALWQGDLAAEFDKNGLLGVEELTAKQLADLTPEGVQ